MECEANAEFLKKTQKLKGTNAAVVGYSKMDDWKNYEKREKKQDTRKRIIISPHHTVVSIGGLHISNFI